MAKSVALCRRLIDRDIAILLQGETGTGKDAFAKALHAESARRARPFIAVNCAAMPDSLLDSELFGYAPGTFTGGLAEGKAGKILASHGGTLFLDEIGDMPLALQARLLRVLEEREVTPLGAVEPRPIDVKLISATHRDLARLVEDGRFREDLYYRINGARITLPALRERRDVAAIARATLDELLPEGPGVEIAPEAQALLSAHSWPGNVRQLRNALRFAAYSCTNGRIVPSDLPDDLRSGPPARPAPADLRQVQRQSERDCLLEALQRARWSVSEAARALGISRATAHRKMRDYGIVRPGRS